MRDKASVNEAAAIRLLRSFLYRDAMDMKCFSHTLDNVGKKMNIPVVRSFMIKWNGVLKNSVVAKLRWHQLNEQSKLSYSPTRWWSWFECVKQVMVNWGDVVKFLIDTDGSICPETIAAAKSYIDVPETQRNLVLELDATVDVGDTLLRATYLCKGDGPRVFRTYSTIEVTQQISHSR
jgi:hypothetical protein